MHHRITIIASHITSLFAAGSFAAAFVLLLLSHNLHPPRKLLYLLLKARREEADFWQYF